MPDAHVLHVRRAAIVFETNIIIDNLVIKNYYLNIMLLYIVIKSRKVEKIGGFSPVGVQWLIRLIFLAVVLP